MHFQYIQSDMTLALALKIMLLILFLFLLSMRAAHAEIYQWTDAEGNTHFSDQKPNVPFQRKELKPISSYESVIPTIKDDSAARQQRIEDRLESKQEQRIENEKIAISDAKKAELCKEVRIEYRQAGTRLSSPNVTLDDLSKIRKRINDINERVKQYCY
ncbi:MAG: DUF4124 domain-containing protein [Oleibacter sp.]|nr:DUF4124 domain-containing protein [Thalassolituus sp.]